MRGAGGPAKVGAKGAKKREEWSDESRRRRAKVGGKGAKKREERGMER